MKKSITDQYSLDKLNKIANGDKEFVQEMILLFLEKAPESLQKIIESYHAKDYSRLANQAHKLKSSLQIIGNKEINDIVKEIEQQSIQGSANELTYTVKELEKQMKSLFIFLKKQS